MGLSAVYCRRVLVIFYEKNSKKKIFLHLKIKLKYNNLSLQNWFNFFLMFLKGCQDLKWTSELNFVSQNMVLTNEIPWEEKKYDLFINKKCSKLYLLCANLKYSSWKYSVAFFLFIYRTTILLNLRYQDLKYRWGNTFNSF